MDPRTIKLRNGVVMISKFRIMAGALAVVFMGGSASALCPAPPVGSQNDTVLKMRANSATPGMGAVSAMGAKAREEGSVVYDAAKKRIAVCDGTSWQPLSAGGSGDPLEACKSLPMGGRCSDGTYYIGTNAQGRRMYVAPADESGPEGNGIMPFRFDHDNNDSGYLGKGAEDYDEIWYPPDDPSDTDGMANSRFFNYREVAGYECRKRGSDWFLPSLDEMKRITSRRGSVPGANISGSKTYWTSTSTRYPGDPTWRDYADAVRGGSSVSGYDYFYFKYAVRCARLDSEFARM
jgi:hypothetical protein